MTHFYPEGALQSELEVLQNAGNTLYFVHGLGSSSFMIEEKVVAGQRNISYAGDAQIVYKEGLLSNNRIFLGDCNIGKHHNHHYLFVSKELAEKYLAWAKTNTPGMRDDCYYLDYWL